ncbi:hypothetical protein [Oerskovia sp. Root918]|uniref:hypothetical protein n=1 Tax=Oerskovia sp. Root918 TaxID=1736607 RepID=UPI0012FAA9BA|nr:hypothetical protein [Oerskovia sp. Root918]
METYEYLHLTQELRGVQRGLVRAVGHAEAEAELIRLISESGFDPSSLDFIEVLNYLGELGWRMLTLDREPARNGVEVRSAFLIRNAGEVDPGSAED